MDIFLAKPSEVYKNEYIKMIKSFEKQNEPLFPFVLNLRFDPFYKLVEKLRDFENGISIGDENVKISVFWLSNAKRQILGVSMVRHSIEKNGGHIAYSISPDFRNLTLGNQILKLTLLEAKKIGINPIFITCEISNLKSEKIIKLNGGVFLEEVNLNGETHKRFVVYD